MTIAGGQIGNSQAAAHAWQAVRADPRFQFAPLPPVPKTTHHTPAWVEWLLHAIEAMLAPVMRAIEAVLAPLARMLGGAWPLVRIALIVCAAGLVLYVGWHIVRTILARRRSGAAAPDPGWSPDRAEAQILLEEAEALAAAGRYAEAVHLLLRRSVAQISTRHPDWLSPSSTAREIAALHGLSTVGRRAFSEISSRVERSRFALRDLDRADWQAARAAYADFAQLAVAA